MKVPNIIDSFSLIKVGNAWGAHTPNNFLEFYEGNKTFVLKP